MPSCPPARPAGPAGFALASVRALGAALVLCLALAPLACKAPLGCEKERAAPPGKAGPAAHPAGEEGEEGAAHSRTGPPEVPAPPPETAPIAPEVPVPDGPAVAPIGLREAPTEAECAAACDRLVAAEARPWVEGAGDAAKEDIEEIVTRLAARERAGCVRRCRTTLSRAATQCVLATEDAAAAVDCLARTGLVGE